MTTENYTSDNIIRHNWQLGEVLELFNQPFNDLLFKSASVHRANFDPNKVQTSTLLSIKTGSCPEDCKYCPQSAHYNTELEKEPLIDIEKVKESAIAAKEAGATRFCMGAAWRSLHDRDMPKVSEMVKTEKDLGLETCVTLGMAREDQLRELKESGLDYYNHNLDTSEEFYGDIITTRTYKDRLETLENVRNADLKTCCGGIVGMGEKLEDRANLLINLANLPTHPESVPINMLVKIDGTPLENIQDLNHLDFVRTIAVARVLMPKSFVRLSAGRETMSDELQALCFFAGANSIFYGDKLLTTANNDKNSDVDLFSNLGIEILSPENKGNFNNSEVA